MVKYSGSPARMILRALKPGVRICSVRMNEAATIRNTTLAASATKTGISAGTKRYGIPAASPAVRYMNQRDLTSIAEMEKHAAAHRSKMVAVNMVPHSLISPLAKTGIRRNQYHNAVIPEVNVRKQRANSLARTLEKIKIQRQKSKLQLKSQKRKNSFSFEFGLELLPFEF